MRGEPSVSPPREKTLEQFIEEKKTEQFQRDNYISTLKRKDSGSPRDYRKVKETITKNEVVWTSKTGEVITTNKLKKGNKLMSNALESDSQLQAHENFSVKYIQAPYGYNKKNEPIPTESPQKTEFLDSQLRENDSFTAKSSAIAPASQIDGDRRTLEIDGKAHFYSVHYPDQNPANLQRSIDGSVNASGYRQRFQSIQPTLSNNSKSKFTVRNYVEDHMNQPVTARNMANSRYQNDLQQQHRGTVISSGQTSFRPNHSYIPPANKSDFIPQFSSTDGKHTPISSRAQQKKMSKDVMFNTHQDQAFLPDLGGLVVQNANNQKTQNNPRFGPPVRGAGLVTADVKQNIYRKVSTADPSSSRPQYR